MKIKFSPSVWSKNRTIYQVTKEPGRIYLRNYLTSEKKQRKHPWKPRGKTRLCLKRKHPQMISVLFSLCEKRHPITKSQSKGNFPSSFPHPTVLWDFKVAVQSTWAAIERTGRQDLNEIWSIQLTKPSTHTWAGQFNFVVHFYQINSLQLLLGRVCNIYTMRNIFLPPKNIYILWFNEYLI